MKPINTWLACRSRSMASILILSALILTGCGKEKEQRALPPPSVSVIKVPEEKVGTYQEFVARTKAVNEVQLRARVEGFLDKRGFVEGQTVKKNQLLFEIDRKPFIANLEKSEADLASAKANLVKAEKDLKRGLSLFKRNFISQANVDTFTKDRDSYSAMVKAAKASVDNARFNLSYTRILAPFSGKIGKVTYNVGNLVSPSSEPLATLTSVNPIYVNFQINENQLIAYEENMRKSSDKNDDKNSSRNYIWSLKLPTGSEYDHKGKLNFSDTSIDQTTGTLNVRASFPNPDGVLYPGMYVTIIAQSKNEKPQPIIPQSAVQEDQSGNFVMVVSSNNIADIRHVEMGRRIGAMWVVKQGLKPGEKLIINGLQKVRAHASVNPTMVTINLKTGDVIQPSPKSSEA